MQGNYSIMYESLSTEKDIGEAFFVVQPKKLIKVLAQINKSFKETLQTIEIYIWKGELLIFF